MDLSIGFGLLAALCWGSSDFVVKLTTEKVGYLRTGMLVQYIGGMFLLLITYQNLTKLWLFPTETCIAIGLGAVNAFATMSLYKSFEVGQLSIVSPVASGYPALSVTLAVLLLHETVTPTRLAGIFAILVGAILVSLQRTEKRVASKKRIAVGVGYALIAFACMGLFYFAIKFVVGNLGSFLPVLVVRCVSALILTGAVALGSRRAMTSTSNFLLLGFVGVVESLAIIAYNLGVSTGSVTVISTVSSLYSAVTVLLAFVALKERLVLHQGLGFLAILVGIGIISYLT